MSKRLGKVRAANRAGQRGRRLDRRYLMSAEFAAISTNRLHWHLWCDNGFGQPDFLPCYRGAPCSTWPYGRLVEIDLAAREGCTQWRIT